MAFSADAGQLVWRTSNGDLVSPSLGFAPKVVICNQVNPNQVVGTAAHAIMGFGAAVDDGSETQFGIATISEDAVSGATDTQRLNRTNIITGLNAAGGVIDTGSLKATTGFGADTFTIDVDLTSGTAGAINYLALGGSDLTNFHLEEIAAPTSAGVVSYTNATFVPDCLIAFTVQHPTAAPSTTTGMGFGLGWATSATDQIAMGCAVDEGDINLVSRRQEDGLLINVFSNTVHTTRGTAKLTATAVAGGYELDWTNVIAGSAFKVYMLALKGPSFKTQTFTSPASAGPESKTGFNFAPKCGMSLSMSDLNQSVLRPNAMAHVGLMSGSTGVVAGIIHDDGSDPTDANSRIQSDEFLQMTNVAGAIAEEANVDTLEADGVDLDWGIATGSAREYGMLCMGDAPAGAGGGGFPTLIHPNRIMG